MDTFLVIVAIIAILGVIAAGVGLWLTRHKKDKKFWISLGVGVASIIALLLAIMGLGRKRKATVKWIDKHTRTVAPTESEKIQTDTDSETLDEKIEEKKEDAEKLNKEATKLDERKKQLEEKSEKTDSLLETLENPRGVSSADDDKPDDSVSDYLRKG